MVGSNVSCCAPAREAPLLEVVEGARPGTAGMSPVRALLGAGKGAMSSSTDSGHRAEGCGGLGGPQKVRLGAC